MVKVSNQCMACRKEYASLCAHNIFFNEHFVAVPENPDTVSLLLY